MNRPRFSDAYGPVDTPPRRVVNSTCAPGRSAAKCSPAARNGAASLTDLQLELGDGLALGVLEVRAAGGDERLDQPPAGGLGPVALVGAAAQRRRLAVVAVGQVAVGVVVGDAHELVAGRVDVDRDLRRLPSRASKSTSVSANVLGLPLTRTGLVERKSCPAKRPTTGVLGPISRPKRGTNTDTPST